MHEFTADMWRSSIEGATWFFVTVPEDISDEIDAIAQTTTRKGFGSVRVQVRVGGTSWATSVFPDAQRGAFVLPMKKAVRVAEGLEENDPVTVVIEPLGPEGVPAAPATSAASTPTTGHRMMFDEDDPILAKVRAICLSFPDAAVKVSRGRPIFFTKKVFCYYGGSLKVDGEWVQHPHSVMVLPDPADRRALEQQDRTFVPAYLGTAGWLGVDLGAETNWQEVAELLEDSYRQTAGPRRVARLDAMRSAGVRPMHLG